MFSILWYLVLLISSLLRLTSVKSKPFEVYWNIPTYLCKNHSVFFSNVSQYGIIQNKNDSFRGNKIAILYEPGHFPALLKNTTTNLTDVHYGGVPHRGNITDHLEAFKQDVDKFIKDENFSGIGIIDFERWRPIFRHNFGSLVIYKNYSKEIVRNETLNCNETQLEEIATKQFEPNATIFMNETLSLAQRLRPNASWGYYAYPYCFNINGAKDGKEDCDAKVQAENEQLQSWLFNKSQIIFPAVYLQTNLDTENRTKLVSGRVKEAVRVANLTKANPLPKVLTYIRFVFTDNTSQYLTKEDWKNILPAMRKNGADGVILWGSSQDVNSKEKCKEFHQYMHGTLGPILKNISKTTR